MEFLDDFTQISIVKEIMKENNLNFNKSGKHKLVPVALNNLFKGILDEFFGEKILEKEGIILQNLDPNEGDIIELFDKKIGNCYFDFKFLSQKTAENEKISKEIFDKTKNKIANTNKKAIIVNICGNSEFICL